MAERFILNVPLDASAIQDFKPDQKVKVVIERGQKALAAETVELDARGHGAATFELPSNPGEVQVALGPADADDDEVVGLQTIRATVPAREWSAERAIKLPPIVITPYYWHWWRRWCRLFTVRGRLVCADGSPVPGAQVCAYDVDFLWWWRSSQQVACATTAADGTFEMRFRWCCGFLPWWWWRHRLWHLELPLAERILPTLQTDPRLGRLPKPGPTPDLALFERLAGGRRDLRMLRGELNPDALVGLREKLVERLPATPDLKALRIWPWWPWQPWFDCNPDLIFRATQDCREPGAVVLAESYFDTRWEVPTTLDVTLVANDRACCAHPPDPEPEGNCLNYTTVCGVSPAHQIDKIGGNFGAPATPAGYRNPGVASTSGDQPFAGVINIFGTFGTTADVDYYEVQWRREGTATWNDMPPSAIGFLPRGYLGNPGVFGEPGFFHGHEFRTTIAGRTLYESRRHFEQNPGWTATLHTWLSNTDLIAVWATSLEDFDDDTYHLRVKGWKWDGVTLTPAAGGVDPAEEGILPLCIGEDLTTANDLVLTLDNRIVGAASGHPVSVPSHPCNAIHLCTMEPDTDVIRVRILDAAGTPKFEVDACSQHPIAAGDQVEIDFLAYDVDGHLAYYELRATYGENLFVDLLALLGGAGTSLVPLPGPAPVPAALQVGPSYDLALADPATPATPPTWSGGALRLRVPAHLAFPEPCCYQLELYARKRTIVNCGTHHDNQSHYSFMILG